LNFFPDFSKTFRAGPAAQNVHVSLFSGSSLNIGSSHWARHRPLEQRHQREKWRLVATVACGSIDSPQSGHFLISVFISTIFSPSLCCNPDQKKTKPLRFGDRKGFVACLRLWPGLLRPDYFLPPSAEQCEI
jgi:hypothetical protein